MAYTDQSKLEARFGADRIAEVFSARLPDGSTTGSADATAVAAACADADAEIDERIGTAYATPVSPVPASLVEIASIIAIWRGMMRHPELLNDKTAKPFETQYRDACKRLDEIHDGKRRLDASLVSKTGGARVNSENVEVARPFYFTPDPAGAGSGGLGHY